MSAQRAAAVRAALDAVVVDNPRARQAHSVFDFLVAHGQSAAATQGPRRCVLLVGPSQSGKSTILKPYVAKRNTPERLEAGEISVLFVDLKPAITTKGLAQNILDAIARHGFTTGGAGARGASESVLLSRVDRLLEAAKVQLLVLDEFHHISNIESRKVAWLVAETVKLLLIEGRCPVVMSGIESAKAPFLENRQLASRAEPPIELARLSATRREDRQLFAEFLKAYVAQAEQVSGLANIARLLDASSAACIHELSQGVLGAACNLVKAAICTAIEAGRSHLVYEDLSDAADRYFVGLGLHPRNPFREGYAEQSPHMGASKPMHRLAATG